MPTKGHTGFCECSGLYVSWLSLQIVSSALHATQHYFFPLSCLCTLRLHVHFMFLDLTATQPNDYLAFGPLTL